jgi:peptidoglycan L-alanyl-D-glutamate endopeptidase CwlK
MTDRDYARLAGIHPALVEAIVDVLQDMSEWGHPMFVVEGVRTQARQVALYAQGRTTKGPIVTYKDGVHHKSHHQPHEDGYGYAVDCAFVDGNPFAQTHPWERFGQALEKRGLTWGGRWKFFDQPHAELELHPIEEGKKA